MLACTECRRKVRLRKIAVDLWLARFAQTDRRNAAVTGSGQFADNVVPSPTRTSIALLDTTIGLIVFSGGKPIACDYMAAAEVETFSVKLQEQGDIIAEQAKSIRELECVPSRLAISSLTLSLRAAIAELMRRVQDLEQRSPVPEGAQASPDRSGSCPLN